MNVTLRDQLKQLRLSELLQSLELRLQEAKSSKLDYSEFLKLILADELIVRRDRQIARRTKAAALDLASSSNFQEGYGETLDCHRKTIIKSALPLWVLEAKGHEQRRMQLENRFKDDS